MPPTKRTSPADKLASALSSRPLFDGPSNPAPKRKRSKAEAAFSGDAPNHTPKPSVDRSTPPNTQPTHKPATNNAPSNQGHNTAHDTINRGGPIENPDFAAPAALPQGHTHTTQDVVDALHPTMRRVLQACMDPRLSEAKTSREHVKLIAADTGLSEATIYRIRRDPAFVAAMTEVMKTAISVHLPAIIQASVHSALMPGRDGFADRHMLLKLAGLATDARQVKHEHHHEHSVSDRLARASAGKEAALKQLAAQDAEQAVQDADWQEIGTDDDADTLEG